MKCGDILDFRKGERVDLEKERGGGGGMTSLTNHEVGLVLLHYLCCQNCLQENLILDLFHEVPLSRG